MDDEAWNADFVRSIGMMLWGNAIEEVDERGEVITGDTLLLLLNAHSDPVPFAMPRLEGDQEWHRILDTNEPSPCCEKQFKPGEQYPLEGRSVAVLKAAQPLRERRRDATPSS
jgi:glycogen operon protein